jgi:hypothetical protein
MGEGWSDWIALMMQIKPGDFGGDKRGIGTFFCTSYRWSGYKRLSVFY